ncbi:FAD-dependent monooxygenase [Alkalihalobacillus hwajinpoensis]|uniref:FAD-dependent oxidoreductase n=1 Tax=Guptibacillus hwajinpoensis TaxID=208199 RepID=UPI001883609B|nr:NAD(P)/FAD-dependent oxidoreductase [Pseudalkalibacillus hwajinpoensis]MBF0708136.1 FAD-dependent monooxygenase [Pseudalkalibacillus hwajinpoensis]
MDYDVMIIGGGISGLTLAVKLGQSNVKTLLIEKDKRSGLIYKGELLQPKSLQVLERINVLDVVKENGFHLPSIEFHEYNQKDDGTMEHLSSNEFRYDVIPSLYNTSLMIPHERLKELLFEEASKYESVDYIQPAKFTGFTEDEPENKKAIIQTKEGEREIQAGFYVGAEGRASPTRTAMEVEMKNTKYNHHFLTVSFPRPETLNQSTIITTQNKFVGLFPLPNNEVRSVLLIKPGEFKSMREEGLQSFYRAYCELMPELEGYVHQIDTWKKIQLMIPVRHNVSNYVKNNLILTGDAAHSVHPMAGEGMNLAIQDSDVLGELLCWMFGTNQTEWKHLKWYEKVRKPRAEYVSTLSHQAALLYSFPYRPWQRLRIKGVNQTEHSPLLHYKQMLNTSGLGIWKFNLLDRLKQAGIIPAAIGNGKLSKHPNEKVMFTKEDDYPWYRK